jgi:hypothetical protein
VVFIGSTAAYANWELLCKKPVAENVIFLAAKPHRVSTFHSQIWHEGQNSLNEAIAFAL